MTGKVISKLRRMYSADKGVNPHEKTFSHKLPSDKENAAQARGTASLA